MKTAVIIPSYRVKKHIGGVLSHIGPEVQMIFVVDDCCPEGTGKFVKDTITDGRVRVIFHEQNQGVGGAVITGYKAALEEGAEILVKLDGDGQMNPELIPIFLRPIISGRADYTKGNRFFHPDYLVSMPKTRILGNTLLSFGNKLINGYWDLMDPTNGFTAIHHVVLRLIPLEKVDRRYFFESDMLFRLNVARAVVADVPMRSVYADEKSSLRIRKVLVSFPGAYFVRLIKRLCFNYFLRDFNLGSIALLVGLFLVAFGTSFGLYHWIGQTPGSPGATAGTVMVAALPIILGVQMLLFFVQFDILSLPRKSVAQSLT